eukprot:2750891-Prymnesium_polylepis.1
MGSAPRASARQNDTKLHGCRTVPARIGSPQPLADAPTRCPNEPAPNDSRLVRPIRSHETLAVMDDDRAPHLW